MCIATTSSAQYTPAITSHRFAESIGRTCDDTEKLVDDLDRDVDDEPEDRDDRPDCEPELDERRRRRRWGSGMQYSKTADR